MLPRLLVYTRTTGYRHDSIPAGVAALRALDGYAVTATEDPAAFRPGQVRGYADQRLRKPQNPEDPSNRRISLIVQYLPKPEAEEPEAPAQPEKHH